MNSILIQVTPDGVELSLGEFGGIESICGRPRSFVGDEKGRQLQALRDGIKTQGGNQFFTALWIDQRVDAIQFNQMFFVWISALE